MTADVELLPLPSVLLNWPHPTNHVAIRDYARACVEANTEALRAEVERLTGCLATANANHEQFERQWYLERDRAVRLAEALRDIQDDALRFATADTVSGDLDAVRRAMARLAVRITATLNPTAAQEAGRE